jgi:RNA polymerase sigma-70 factor (ECF subfamily)
VSQILQTFLKHDVLKRFLSRLLPSADDVDEIAQEEFLRAFAAEATQTVLAPKAFLFRIARNLALNERSRFWNTTIRRGGTASDLGLLSRSDDVSAEDRLDGPRKLALFEEAIHSLPSQCRSAFVAHKVDGVSGRDIAEKMGISPKTGEKYVAIGLLGCSEYLRQRGYDVRQHASTRLTVGS